MSSQFPLLHQLFQELAALFSIGEEPGEPPIEEPPEEEPEEEEPPPVLGGQAVRGTLSPLSWNFRIGEKHTFRAVALNAQNAETSWPEGTEFLWEPRASRNAAVRVSEDGWTPEDSVEVEALKAGTAKVLVSARGPLQIILDSQAVVADEVDPTPDPDPGPQLPTGTNLTPPELDASIGPLVAMGPSSVLKALDVLFLKEEPVIYDAWSKSRGTATTMNHYGALRSRLQFAIRHGQEYGLGAEDPTKYLYGHGREVQDHYLNKYAHPSHGPQQHNNTALADIEALYVLENDREAYDHIWGSATSGISLPWYRLDLTKSDPRQVAVPIAAINACVRLGMPFSKFPGSGSSWNDVKATSWVDAGEMIIEAALAAGEIHSDGAVISVAHFGQCGTAEVEAYFMSAMLATEFLRWHAFVAPNQPAYDMAIKIVEHFLAEDQRHGLGALPYLSCQKNPAWDLAGMFVWVSLVAWQDTNQDEFRTFALKNINAAKKAYLKTKQFNQTFSTGVQNADALLAGIYWTGK